MMREIAKLHVLALPHTLSSKRGEKFVEYLYKIVSWLGYVKYVKREGRLVGVISGIGRVILTLVVDPEWQRQGIGRELVGQLTGRRYVYTEECSYGFYEKNGFVQIIKLGKIIFLWKK
jgi:GNAT superfamily N-acetyltransferase